MLNSQKSQSSSFAFKRGDSGGDCESVVEITEGNVKTIIKFPAGVFVPCQQDLQLFANVVSKQIVADPHVLLKESETLQEAGRGQFQSYDVLMTQEEWKKSDEGGTVVVRNALDKLSIQDLKFLQFSSSLPHMDVQKKYTNFETIGFGSFGEVFRAHRVGDPSCVVAIKRFRSEMTNVLWVRAVTREMRLMHALSHPNVVQLHEVLFDVKPSETVPRPSFVFEYCDFDLNDLLSDLVFSEAQTKMIMFQLLKGIEYVHRNRIIHRDLKPQNILVTREGVVKICDFGIALHINEKDGRSFQDVPTVYTNVVVSLWYRCPELLLGAKEYDTSLDMWSLGCIMAEFFVGDPILQGTSEKEQLEAIILTCGAAAFGRWPWAYFASCWK